VISIQLTTAEGYCDDKIAKYSPDILSREKIETRDILTGIIIREEALCTTANIEETKTSTENDNVDTFMKMETIEENIPITLEDSPDVEMSEEFEIPLDTTT